jgi:hypothetical protein
MTAPIGEGPRKRPRVDARHWAAGLAAAIAFATGLVRDGTGILEISITVLIAFVWAFIIGFIVINPSRNPDAPVWPVAWMFLLAGVLAGVAILLIPVSFWPS